MKLQTTHEVVNGTFHVQPASIELDRSATKISGSVVVWPAGFFVPIHKLVLDEPATCAIGLERGGLIASGAGACSRARNAVFGCCSGLASVR
jgi:hypothetical protein